jgi:hypothetical protein
MQLLSPRYLEFVRHFVDAATTHTLLVDLARLRCVTVETKRPEDETSKPREQRDAA